MCVSGFLAHTTLRPVQPDWQLPRKSEASHAEARRARSHYLRVSASPRETAPHGCPRDAHQSAKRARAPAQTTGTFTEPRVALMVPLALMARENTGNFVAVRSLTSRTPPSMTRPRAPRARKLVANRSPKKPSSLSLVHAATATSPSFN